jgi:acetyl esterase/lipase/hemerythrin-like domain-containing protein
MPKKVVRVVASNNSPQRWDLPAPLIAILDEHRYVLRLIKMLEHEANILLEGGPADYGTIDDVLSYIICYPDRFHHPKEELIFDRMVNANKQTQKTLNTLRRDHKRVASMGKEMTNLLADVLKPRCTKKKKQEFANSLHSYIARLRAHIELEETQIFEPAATLLSKADWKAIDKQIKPIIDPVFGEKKSKEFEKLFRRYISHAVTVSTGAVSPKNIEKIAASFERMIYASGQVRRLPARLCDKFKNNKRSQLKFFKKLLNARDIKSIQRAYSEAKKYSSSAESAYWPMVKDALMALEPLDDKSARFADRKFAHSGAAITLKDAGDFEGYSSGNVDSHKYQISWQAVLTNLLLRLTIKQLMGFLGPDGAQHAKKLSAYMDGVPDGIKAEELEFGDFRARWIKPKGQRATNKTILYIPGGGFIFPASTAHTTILSRLVKKTRSQGLLVHYRLAPEHPFPAGLEDALYSYRYLLDSGIASEDIVIAGDSAGGGLTLSLLQALKEEGLPMPAAAALISPLADLSFSGESRQFNRWRDPMLPTQRKMRAFEEYTSDTPSEHPLLSPVYGDLSGFPPLFAQVGSTEILLDDTLRVAQRAREQGVEVEVEIWHSLPHVWHLWSYLPETEEAISRIAEFFMKRFGAANIELKKSA